MSVLRGVVGDAAREIRGAILRTAGSLATRRPRRTNIMFLSADEGGTFFGYHDKTPGDIEGYKILAMNVAASDRNATSRTSLRLGYFDLSANSDSPQFRVCTASDAWCWQQGCMLQWDPQDRARRFVYNTINEGAFVARAFDIVAGADVEAYAVPVYALDPQGRYALSVNFSRLERLRPGYGYGQLSDSTAHNGAPADDGMFLIDRTTHHLTLVVPLDALAAEVGRPDAEHYVNHILVAPDGESVAFLHLWTDGTRRQGRLCVYDVASGSYRVLESERVVSHMCWRRDRQLLATTRAASGHWRYTLYDLTQPSSHDTPFTVGRDGHPMIHPVNPDLVVTDTYPDARRIQSVYVGNLVSGETALVGEFYAPVRFKGPERCDLHPRWDAAGNRIIVDTTARGHREMAILTPDNDFWVNAP